MKFSIFKNYPNKVETPMFLLLFIIKIIYVIFLG